MKNTLINLTQKLISIPSWVDDNTDESEIGNYIFDYLVSNSNLKVEKQTVVNNRFNIFAQNSDNIDTLVIGHIDTVQPSKSWTQNPISPNIIGNELYGLGSSDMKSGVAVMLESAISPKLKPNTAFLFYIDEEYNFSGINSFIKENKSKINPKQIISLDGLNLKITNGCRGLIEISVTITGKSGHAAIPKCGINAITNSSIIIKKLSNYLTKFKNQELGVTSLNIAYINGGQFQGGDNNQLILGKQGNIIADVCQFVIDIRPSTNNLDSKKIINFIDQESKKIGVKLLNYSVRYDYKNWITPKEKLNSNCTNQFNQIDQTGYIDVQLLWQAFNKVPCFTIGAGLIENAHNADEFIEINKLLKLQKIINKLLNVKINYVSK